MKNSEIYKIAILAVIGWHEKYELSEDSFCELLYKLTQDWKWSHEAELEADAKAEEAKAKEEALKEIHRVSEAYSEKTATSLNDEMNELRRKIEEADND